MTVKKLRCVIVASAGGSVMNELLKNEFFKSQITAVVSDRLCPAIDKAQRHDVHTEIIPERDKSVFCDHLLSFLRAYQADYVISFFTKLFVGELLTQYQDRILNLHPSLLPSFKGLDGFGDTVRYGTRYAGTTIHFIDGNMDEGKIIQQTVFPLDPDAGEALLRHRIFEQQCRSLLQVVRWLSEDRIHVDDQRVTVTDAVYQSFEFSPDLDFKDALELNIPFAST